MTWNATAQTLLASRKGLGIRWLLWVDAYDRTTGDVDAMGLWSGEDHATFNIDGTDRLYLGALDGMTCDPVKYQSGTTIQSFGMSVPMDTDAAKALFRVRETRFAKCEVHWALYDEENNTFADARRMFKGFIDGNPITQPAGNGRESVSIVIASALRAGTKMSGARKSDSMQRLRGGDLGRRYGDLGRIVNDEWK